MLDDDSISLRLATAKDADSVARIYNHYILNTLATFEVDEVTGDEVRRRMDLVGSYSLPWIVAESDGQILGYAYANRWHQRAAYQFAAETTVYLDHQQCRRGIGSRLYEYLLDLVGQTKIHTVIGGISLPNDASVSLHERFGFKKAAHYHQVGRKFGQWIDVGYWQRMLRARDETPD